MKRLWSLIPICIVLAACREGGGNVAGDVGFLSLTITENQRFDPSAEPGRVKAFRITLAGEALNPPIVDYYPPTASSARFDGFAHGTKVRVTVEALNDNGAVVRRGDSGEITIEGGRAAPAPIALNNVPIFANVRDGATVNARRFVPKVFAPGIGFELTDTHAGETRFVRDELTGEASFSVSDGEGSVRAVHMEPPAEGEHVLTVRDPESGEATAITVTVVNAEENVLPTTAGAYLGSMASRPGERLSSLPLVHVLLTE